jgi:hypothetical protein
MLIVQDTVYLADLEQKNLRIMQYIRESEDRYRSPYSLE